MLAYAKVRFSHDEAHFKKIHDRPYHPESQRKLEKTNALIKKYANVLTNIKIRSRLSQRPALICSNLCIMSQSTAMVMSGRCLHFMGLLPNIRMS